MIDKNRSQYDPMGCTDSWNFRHQILQFLCLHRKHLLIPKKLLLQGTFFSRSSSFFLYRSCP